MLEKLTKIFHKKNKRNFSKNEKGQALVELAFVLPILLLLVFGIIEFGNIFFTHLTLNNAAREGARAGALMATRHDVDLETEINEIIQDRVYGNIDYDYIEVNIFPAKKDDMVRGEKLRVEIEYDQKLLTPLFGMVLDNQEPSGYTSLSTQTTMRIE